MKPSKHGQGVPEIRTFFRKTSYDYIDYTAGTNGVIKLRVKGAKAAGDSELLREMYQLGLEAASKAK